MDLNDVTLIGRLATDPYATVNEAEPQKIRIFFPLACGRRGSKEADFPPVVAFGKVAAAGMVHLKKGKEVTVKGRLHTYKVGEGEKVETKMEVIANSISYGSDPGKKSQAAADSVVAEVLEKLKSQGINLEVPLNNNESDDTPFDL